MRQILVFGEKTFRLTIPDDTKVTFGPWSPPKDNQRNYEARDARGTLRVYGRTKEDVLAVCTGVTGFRDLSLGYAEVVVREEGATIWKDDEHGYVRENKVKATQEWTVPELPAGESDL